MDNIYDEKEFYDAYSKMPRSVGGLTAAGEWHALEPLFPPLDGKAVLDLGCGYGWHCVYAAEHGAKSVLGIDLSRNMIEGARQRNSHPGIAYEVCGIDSYSYPENAFDLAVSNLALHYIADLDAVYRNVYKTLKRGGTFLFNIEHPIFTAGVKEDWIYDADGKPLYWAIDDYYSAGERETFFLGQKVKKQHHTLTQILMGLINAGFALDAVIEAQPSEEMRKLPEMRDEMRRPMMLLVKASKRG